jgi:hypothetical protein
MWWRASVALCLLATISGCGGSGDDQAKQQLSQAQAQIRTERQAAQEELATIRQEVSDEQDKLARYRAKVARERRKLKTASAQVAKSTIPGTGTFVVGTDITPGTYRADAQPGCYWARLNSLDTSDIADNDNADGPVVVEILPSDKAFETNDCADFHRAG